MHFLLVCRRFVCWMGTLSLVFGSSGNLQGQFELQNWLDSMSSFVEKYDQLIEHLAESKVPDFDIDVTTVLTSQDRQREEARIDCLANRLLAEEYQPYDFDIRETMWCKGWAGSTDLSTNFSKIEETYTPTLLEAANLDSAVEEIDVRSQSLKLPLPDWLTAIRENVWAGFKARVHEDWGLALSQATFISERVEVVVSEVARLQLETHLATKPSLRSIFGRSVLPYEVGLTSSEYATLTIQIWEKLRSKANIDSILPQSTWYQMRPTGLNPIYDLMTKIPSLVPITQR